MDSGGNMYVEKALGEQLESIGVSARKMRKPEKMPRSTITIDDPVIAAALAQMPKVARVVFHGSRKNGASEQVAYARAEARSKQGRKR